MMRAWIAKCLTLTLAKWLVCLLNWIDPPYGAHAKAPGAPAAGIAAADASPPSSARGPLHRSSPSPLRGRPVQSLSPEADRVTRPMILALMEARPVKCPAGMGYQRGGAPPAAPGAAGRVMAGIAWAVITWLRLVLELAREGWLPPGRVRDPRV